MPRVEGAPAGLNRLLEEVYGDCMDRRNDKGYCSRVSWEAARRAGWRKDPKSGRWTRKDATFNDVADFFEKRKASVVQSILLSREKFKRKAEAVSWLRGHGRRYNRIDRTERYWRCRQRDPGDFVEGSFRTYAVDDGIKLILGRLRGGG